MHTHYPSHPPPIHSWDYTVVLVMGMQNYVSIQEK